MTHEKNFRGGEGQWLPGEDVIPDDGVPKYAWPHSLPLEEERCQQVKMGSKKKNPIPKRRGA